MILVISLFSNVNNLDANKEGLLHVTYDIILYHQTTSHNLWAGKIETSPNCWNYFTFGHGKGEVDGEGVFLKCEIRKEQIKPQAQQLQNVHDVVHFYQEHVGMPIFNYNYQFS